MGDGSASQILDIVGFQPEWLLVKRDGDVERWTMKPASTGPSMDYSLFVSNQPGSTDLIRALRPLGFEVGSRLEVNNSPSTYHWIAFAGAGDSGQVHYRWRFDDGDEVFATWAGPEDTPLNGLPKNTIRRLRFQVFNESGVPSGAVAYQLEVAETATCGLGTYAPVPIAATTEHWEIVDSPNILDGEATTDVTPGLSNAATTFIPGEVKEAGNTTSPISLNDDEFTEIEFVIQATSNATDGGDYCFRLFDATNTGPLPFYMEYAQVRVAGAGGPSLTLADHDVGQIPDQFATTTPVLATELFRFKLSTTGTVTVDNIRVHFSTTGGVVNGDVTNGDLYRDENDDGLIDGGDTPLVTGVAATGGFLAFTSLGESPGAGANYLVRADVANLVPGDTTTFSLDLSDIDEVEVGVAESGASSNAVHTQDSASGGDVFYSIGTDNLNLMNGSPNITITNGTAYLSVAQAGNISVGDEIDHGSKVYIKSVISQTRFVVHAPAGGMPTDTGSVGVNFIGRAFNDFATAISNSGDLTHLNSPAWPPNTNLIVAGANLTWVFYDDNPFNMDQAIINFYDTDASHTLTLTAAKASQVASGVSQQHAGVAATGARLVANTSGGPTLIVMDNYVTVEWLEPPRVFRRLF